MSRGNDGHRVVIRSLEAIFIFDIKKHKHLRTTSRPARWRWLRPSQRRWFSESYSSRRTGSRCCSQRCRSEEEEEMMKVMISSLMTFIFCIKAAGFISSRSDACVYPPASISVLIFPALFWISMSYTAAIWNRRKLHLQHLSSVNMLHTKRHHEANEIFIICASCIRTPALYFNVWIDYSVRNGRKKMLRPK